MFVWAMGSSSFRGSIPSEYGQIQVLSWFSFHENILTGPLPTQLPLLFISPENLQVGYNRLAGVLPTELGLLQTLYFVRPQVNQFSGLLSTEFGSLTQQTGFFYSINRFEGRISKEITNNCTEIQVMFLYIKLFSGSLPSLSSMEGLIGAPGKCVSTLKYSILMHIQIVHIFIYDTHTHIVLSLYIYILYIYMCYIRMLIVPHLS